MAETAKAYNNAPKHLMNGDIVIGTSTIKGMLLTAYTPAQTHDTIADVLAAGTESTGSGYTARGDRDRVDLGVGGCDETRGVGRPFVDDRESWHIDGRVHRLLQGHRHLAVHEC